MKKLTNYIFAALLLLMTAGLQAQVVEVCAGDGTDSVTLSLAQYQYGNIQWQYSEDTLTWTDILGAHDTVFRCLPERECYYRARIEYPNCPLDTTQVTHILFTPTANAGPDRILNEGYVTTLFGNKVEDGNTRCMWQVIEGDSPDLEDPTYRNSRFTGPDTLYKLTWTVANACGVSVDTVEIRYVHTVMYDAIAIVDTTDIILSDSAERASGIYRIVFSNPAPNITDSTVLVGMVDEGFLRKVLYFEYYGDTCEMVTSQGYITDILKEGAINLEIPMSLAASSQRGGAYHTYTRAELLQDSRFLSGNWGALLDGLAQSYQRDLIVNNWNMGDVTLGGHWDIQDLTPDFSDVKLIEDWYVHPYLVFGNGYVSFKVGFMGDAKVDFKLHASQFATPFHITKDISPLTFGLPGLANVKLGVSLDFAVTLSANLSDGIEKQYIYTRPIYYVAEGEVLVAGGVPIPINIDFDTTKAGEGKIVEIEPEHINTNVSLELSLAIGPKLSGILLFKTLELYLEFMPKIAFVFCYGANGFKSDSTDLRLYEEIGLKVIGLWNPNMFWEQTLKTWKRPYRMAMGPNTNRNLVPPALGAWISDPILVQVFKKNGDPIGGNTVLFETSDGVVSATPSGAGSASVFATTNVNGIAQIYWKPDNTVAPTLKASVLDCEGNHIEGSPLWFYADNVCSNSTLALDVRDGHLSPSGYDGAYGYLFLEYSSDNINWSNTAPYPLVPGTTYFVRDNNGCIASTTYTVQEATPACNLTTNAYQNGMRVRFVVNNGTAPYHFYVDGVDQAPSGTTQRVLQYDFTTEGSHSLSVTDANGCTTSTLVNLTDGITPPTVVTIERYNTANQVYDAVMGAVTDNGGAEVAERGIQWSLSSDMSNATLVPSSITGDGLGRFVCQISGVSAGATYYARAYATNSKGPGYGNIITLTVPGTTPGPGSTTSCGVSSVRANETGGNGTITAVRDHQNNSYAVVQIGNQCWLKENMRCTTSPSTGANMVENPAVEANMSTTVRHAYYYDNNPANAANGYGLLYNWPAAMDGNTVEGARGICPEGWHLPTNAEWTTLMNTAVSIYQPGVTPSPAFGSQYDDFEGANTDISQMLFDFSDNSLQLFYSSLGVSTYAEMIQYVEQMYQQGQATQEEYNSIMQYFNSTRRNATGFTAVPAGFFIGGFYARGGDVVYWSSSPFVSGLEWVREWTYGLAGVSREYANKEGAIAVRCLRNDGGISAAVLPTVTTSAVENVTATSATCGGNVSSDGGAAVTARGVCWSTNQNPTISDNHTTDGSGVGSFASNISGLTAGNTYYVRAYATNSVGTAYGNEVSVTVPGSTPGPGSTTSCNVSSVRANETGSNGTITAVRDHQNNSYAVVQIGNQCWLKENMRCTTSPSTGANIVENPANGTSSTERRAYYFHNDPANFANGYGLLYNWPAAMDGSTEEGARGICPEGWHLPTDAEWNALVNYVSSQSGCICSGNNSYIAKALASETDWNTSTIDCAVGKTLSTNNASGFSALPAGYYYSGGYSVSGNITIFWTSTQYNSIGAYISNLNYNTASVYINPNAMSNGYSVRCLRNDGGASAAVLPTVSTSAVENVTATSATCGGNVTSDGGANVTARGICWSTSQNPTISDSHTTDGSGVGSFSSNISGLIAGVAYYVRAYATNGVGTAYGNEVSFTIYGSTPGPGSTTSCGVAFVRANETGSNDTITAVRDHQNNSYAVVQIGNQCWLKENMRCTTSPSTGANMVENPAVEANMSATVRRAYYYDNNLANAANGYGLLYNWPAAMDGSTAEGARGICPEGWHLPTDAEWTTLMNTAVSIYQPGVTPTSQTMANNARIEGGNTAISSMLSGGADWQTDNSGEATPGNFSHALRNATGFSAVPSGGFYGVFNGRGQGTDYWSSSINNGRVWAWECVYSLAGVGQGYADVVNAVAVRCLRNDGGTSMTVLPTVSTSAVENVTATSATCGGNVTSDGGANVTARGVCWSTNQNPTISDNHTTDGSGVGSFTSNISGLTAGNTYYVRAYATNCVGTAYGNEVFVTVPGSTPGPGSTTSCGVSSVRANETGSNGTITAVRDHQNNSYAVVQIGNQCWLKENMRCTTSPSTGANMVENPAVEANMSATVRRAYYYDNNPANAANGYGLLYNWPAAMDGSTVEGARGICPEGWHLPTDAEWTTLMNTAVSIYQPGVTPSPAFGSQDGDFEGSNTDISQMLLDFSDNSLQYFYSSLGVSTYAEMIQYVEQMYQQGQVDQAEHNMIMQYFNSPRRNVTGFSAVPAGVYNGIFEFRGQYVGYCSSSAYDSSNAWYRVLLYLNAGVGRVYDGKEFAASVRCVRN